MSTPPDTNLHPTDEATQADALREAMITQMREMTAIRSDRVADAFHTVPRHLFAPGATLEQSYAQDTVRLKRDEHGATLSAVSAPWLQATMLEQAQLDAGMRVLEIGSGGYNAALITELVGETGQVTTVDIDLDVIDRARGCLAATGYDKVNVVLADAENGVPGHAPYDRIIVTVGAWDIPPAWLDQLAQGGRIIVPLRMRGLTRSVTFERDGNHLVSLDYRLCGFVPMQGAGAHTEQVFALDADEVRLHVDEALPVDADRLRESLFASRVERWCEVEIGGVEPFDGLDLWIATAAKGFCLLAATKTAIDSGLVGRLTGHGAPTMVAGGSFAYRTARRISSDTSRFEFGVYAHGPDAEGLADQCAGLIQTWDRDHRHGPGARIEVYPAATPDADLPKGRLIDKGHTRVVISWP